MNQMGFVFCLFVFNRLLLIFPGRKDRPEGICEEAYQTEPTRQHEQQGEEEDKELHDDET